MLKITFFISCNIAAFRIVLCVFKYNLIYTTLEHYKHVAIGIATMTVHDLRPNQAHRFIMINAGGLMIHLQLQVIPP